MSTEATYKPYDPNDATFLKRSLENGGHPYNTVQYWYRTGLMDETDWALYQFYWRNSGPKFSDIAARYQLKD